MILSVALTVVAAYGVGRIGLENDYRIFFSEDNPQLTTFNQLQDTYTKSDNVLVMLLPKSGDVFEPIVIQAIAELTEQSWQIPYSRRVDSLTNFQHSYAEDDDLIVDDLISDFSSIEQADLDRAKAVAISEPELVNRLVSAGGHAAGVNITLELPLLEPLKEPKEVMRASAAMLDDFRDRYPDIDFHVSGVIPLNDAFSEYARGDLKNLSPVMLLVIALCLWFLYRSISLVVVSFLMIALAIISALGITGWLGININSVSMMAPTIIITIAVADAVHIIISVQQFMRAGMDKAAAVTKSLQVNFGPVLITSITTAIGFLALNFSDSPPLRELGTIVAIGVAAAFVFSVSLLPALIVLLPLRTYRNNNTDPGVLARLADLVINNYRKLLMLLAILVVVVGWQIKRIELSDVFVNYFDESTQIRQDSDAIIKNLTGVYSHNYSFSAPGVVTEPEFLSQLDRFAQWLEMQPEVKYVSVVTNTLKRLNKNLNADNSDFYRLPENQEQAAQFLLLYEISLPFGFDLTNHVNLPKTATKVGVNIDTLSSREINAFEERAQTWLQAETPLLRSTGAGPATMFAQISYRNVASMLTGTLVALLLISLILVFALKSLRLGIISLVPNLTPAIVAFGIWGLIHGVVGLATSVVAAVTLGIVVDDTVHFLSKYKKARSEKGYSPEAAIRYSFDTVGAAIFVNTTVLVLGFLVLTFSHFAINAEMGLLTAITIGVALILDFLLLPPLLLLFDREKPALAPSVSQ